MRIRGIGRLRRVVRRLRNRFAPGALILLYHRVIELPTDPQLLCVTPQHFAEHLEVLRKHYHPMSLKELVAACLDGKVPPRAVAITFDDGYRDNLSYAKPLLAEYDNSATVFVATGYLRQDREFWWDELDRLLLSPGNLPQTLRLSVSGNIYQSELGEAAHYSDDTFQSFRHWNVLDQHDPGPRQHLYRSFHQMLRPLTESERLKALNELSVYVGSEQTARTTHRALSPDEVFQLADGGLIEVGAHTVTHPSLSAIPAALQQNEIRQSKTRLEEILGRPVTSFAYPYGTQSDYTAETVQIVREAGFACACSNFPGLLEQRTDPYQLPRFLVRDWDGEEFASRLRNWFSG